MAAVNWMFIQDQNTATSPALVLDLPNIDIPWARCIWITGLQPLGSATQVETPATRPQPSSLCALGQNVS